MGMKLPCTTVYETRYFEIYHDALGRYWVWNKVEQVNHAYRVADEITAYRTAMDSAIHYIQLHKRERETATKNLAKFEELAEQIWPRDEYDQ